jgi:CheY-like chemotaxis protein
MNKPRVLLVDDDRSVLDALGTVIESEGFELVRAADGHEAVEKFRQQPIDIVLLDLNMPVKGGWDTLERLTTINPLLPIIVITARSDAYPVAMDTGVAALMAHSPPGSTGVRGSAPFRLRAPGAAASESPDTTNPYVLGASHLAQP